MNDSKLYSQEAEQSVLGAIMLDEIAFDIVTEVGLQASHFYGGNHKLVFEAITHLSESAQSTDLITVVERLKLIGKLEAANGPAYLSQMVDNTLSIDNAKDYAAIIMDLSRRRSLVALSGDIRAKIDEGAETEEVEEFVDQALTGLVDSNKQKTQYTQKESLQSLLDRTQRRMDGEDTSYPTEIEDLDDVVMIEGGRLTIIAGRPSMGKSALAVNIGERNANRGVSVQYYSFEMSEDEIAQRQMAAQFEVNRDIFKHPNDAKLFDEWAKVSAATQAMIKRNAPFCIETKSGMTAHQIATSFRSFCRKSESYQERGEAMLIVDQLTLIKLSNKENRTHGLGEVTKIFKRLAMELKVPVILLHQLNRSLEQRPNKRPMLSDLRDSGELEEDADIVIFPYRDEYYDIDSPLKGTAEMIVAKNRGGSKRTCYASDEMRHSRFTSLKTPFQSQN